MKWRIIDKKNATAPTVGTYSQWKSQLAREAGSQCVYCCIPESKFGGIRNFHVEHFKPKSIFPLLTNTYSNLFYACGICNIFKSDDWPSEHQIGRYDQPVYPDPSLVDYSYFLVIDELSGKVKSETLTGKYLIERLHLNRPQMIGLRVMSSLFLRLDKSIEKIEALLQSGSINSKNESEVTLLLIEMYKIARKYSEVTPYGADQLR